MTTDDEQDGSATSSRGPGGSADKEPAARPAPEDSAVPSGAQARLPLLVFSALGIVYGDIGTSPLYAFRECFAPENGLGVGPANVLGILSLIFWALIVVVSAKYLGYVMRADNRGEGGVLALTALTCRGKRPAPQALLLIGLFGAALLYGDGVITPAISVLSALEGLQVAAPGFEPWVVPSALVILAALFGLQRRGTAHVGRLFAPVVLLWFTVLSLLGLASIFQRPDVLAAISPHHGLGLLMRHPAEGFFALGSVFLVVTGAEALYADMGHFGPRPIRIAWFVVVLPALTLNYFGQGALLLESPEAARNPFYLLAPSWMLYPLVALATAATIVASQAVVSGAFSLTRQAVQLGFLPRTEIRHTSDEELGQIYVPAVNWALMAATMLLVLFFQSSGSLAAAYGIAVSTTMVITTVLAARVARIRWRWSPGAVAAVTGLLLVVDLTFLAANLRKTATGGWLPLALAAIVLISFLTWRDGRRRLADQFAHLRVSMRSVIEDSAWREITRVPGTAVFMVSDPEGAPLVMLHYLKHVRALHERVVLLTIRTRETPTVSADERVKVVEISPGVLRVIGYYGFTEQPNVPGLLAACRRQGFELSADESTFLLGRETIVADGSSMARWRGRLFAFMSRNAETATAYFGIPRGRVVELGVQVGI